MDERSGLTREGGEQALANHRIPGVWGEGLDGGEPDVDRGIKGERADEVGEDPAVGALEIEGGEHGLEAFAGGFLLEEGGGDEAAHGLHLGLERSDFLLGGIIHDRGGGGRSKESHADEHAKGEHGEGAGKLKGGSRGQERGEETVEATLGESEGADTVGVALVRLKHGVELLAQARAGLLGGGEGVKFARDFLEGGPFALAGGAAGEVGAGWAATDRQQLPGEEFARLPEVQAAIDYAKFDQLLLVAAIFQETNRVRRQLGLVPFTHLPKLDEAADLKATIGVLQGELSHENPLPLTATPADRVRAAGLSYRQVAENIARLGILDLPAGNTQLGLGVRKRQGRDEYYQLETKRTVESRTYAGFAAAVVQAWMNSPSHRANILNPEYASLGCGARAGRDLVNGHEQIYAVQVFFTPR